MTDHNTQIVIVGGGFGGVRAARRLAGRANADITLISDQDSFAYYPQLYHAATGGARSESTIPLKDLVGNRVKVVQDTIATINPEAHTITGTSGQTYQYDELVLALGSVTNYFGIQGLPEFSYNIKSIQGAERFKQHLHKELIEDQKPDPNYVIVGGGPTGVELAAALGSYLRRITKRHELGRPRFRIELVEAAPRILPRSPEAMSKRVQRRLESLGVEVMTGTTVQAETAEALQVGGQSIATKTVVWTAGMANNPFFKANAAHFALAKNGKVQVDDHLQAQPHVYVIGDNAATPYSGLAQTAVSDADYAAADIMNVLRHRPRRAYRAKTPMPVIPVGDYWSAFQWGPLRLYGYVGYMLRRLGDLVGYADIESWPKAIKVWLQDGRHEDDCPVCSPQSAASSS